MRTHSNSILFLVSVNIEGRRENGGVTKVLGNSSSATSSIIPVWFVLMDAVGVSNLSIRAIDLFNCRFCRSTSVIDLAWGRRMIRHGERVEMIPMVGRRERMRPAAAPNGGREAMPHCSEGFERRRQIGRAHV